MSTPPELWPVFICYRRVDGSAAARRLYEILDQRQETGPAGHDIKLDVYLDETVPGVADWRAVHRPYLEKARAFIVVCTPGAKLNEGPDDWVHQEIDWWVGHRDAAPILIDPLMEGLRYVPTAIAEKWPDIQRIPLVEKEWASASGIELERKVEDLRRHVVGALLPSGAAIYEKELADERRRARRLQRALIGVAILFLLALAATYVAFDRQRVARRNERIASASLLDTQASSAFSESRLIDARLELERNRRREIVESLGDTAEGVRAANLRHELHQLEVDVAALKRSHKEALERGRELLRNADREWEELAARTDRVSRTRPDPPYILSIELMNAGEGESILVHYGTPDDIRLIMFNAGPRKDFEATVAPRLRALSQDRFDGRPVPIELFVVGDRDADKTGGLEVLLSGMAGASDETPALVELRGIWANIFRLQGERETFRSRLRQRIDDLEIPLNQPFDRHIVRPERGRAEVTLPGGLEIVVLGPALEQLHELLEMSAREQEVRSVEPLVAEGFARVSIATEVAPLTVSEDLTARKGECVPSENARAQATGTYRDRSISNLASTVVLLRFEGKTLLFTGDARGDLILEGLAAADLLDQNGRATVDLMTIPHLGSDHNVTVDFFERVRASGYLFSGNGQHGNPEVGTVAALVTARGCDSYRMYFVNRDGIAGRVGAARLARDLLRGQAEDIDAGEFGLGAPETLGERLDAFFREEERFNPNYRRVFRSSEGGSVIIDMLTPVGR